MHVGRRGLGNSSRGDGALRPLHVASPQTLCVRNTDDPYFTPEATAQRRGPARGHTDGA